MFPALKSTEGVNLMRNFIFGVEDSLVSTVGLLSGIAAAGQDSKTIILAGVVLIFVEAFSMAVGSLLSDNSVKELESGSEVPLARSFLGSMIMLASYFFSGIIPLAPYMFLAESDAFLVSVALSLVSLFALGMIAGKMSGVSSFREGIKMCTVGGIAILLGVMVGTLVNGFLR